MVGFKTPSIAMLAFVVQASLMHGAPPSLPATSVGMASRVEQVVLDGSELEAKPIEDHKMPIVLRVVASYPHGTAFRYDLEYYGLEPGKFDLRDFLKRKDGSTTTDLPELLVTIESILPPGHVLPHDLAPDRPPRLGGYRLLVALAMLLWVAALLAILFAKRKRMDAATIAVHKPLTIAERLRPLVTKAVAGKLDTVGQAELERLLTTYWSQKLDLADLTPAAAAAKLRQHPEAGQLLRLVEDWLHKPEGAGQIDLAEILRPYQDLPHEDADRITTFNGSSPAPRPTSAGAGR